MPGKRQRTESSSKGVKKPRRAPSLTPSGSSDGSSGGDYDSEVDMGGNDQYLHSDSEEDEFEGLATYEVDDWDGEDGGEGSGGSDEDEDEADIASELQSIPLASLVKAQKSLNKAKSKDSASSKSLSSEERIRKARKALAAMQGKKFDEGDSDSGSESGEGSDAGRRSGRHESRSNKHAPQAMSTKHQVSRTRPALPLSTRKSHDPRFLSTAGRLDSTLHSQSYDFLPTLLADEMKQLRQDLIAAQKLEKSCPLRDKPARTAEREEIERSVARLRTRLDKQKRETREREVLADVKREERKKREEGKGAWYMKKGEKRDLLLKARFDALQAEGKTALKKAMDRKRKKVAGKEKKSRPNVRRAT